MEEYNQTCTECGKEFHVQVTTMNVPGGKEKRGGDMSLLSC